MAAQVTHENDVHPVTGKRYLRQIVSARELRNALRRDGESLARPKDFGPDDEWDVGRGRRV